MSAEAEVVPPKKKKKKKKRELTFKERWQLFLFSLLEVFYSTKSEEHDERRMAKFAVVAAATGAAFLVLGIMTTAILHTVYRGEEGVSLAEVLRQKALEGKKETVFQNIGYFTIELKRPVAVGTVSTPGAPVVAGITPLAEFNLTVECDGQVPCDFVKNNTDVVKSEVTAVLLPIEREEMLSRDGKDKLKKTLIQRLNSVVPLGQIVNVHFESLRVD
jgi:flagellar basal body-associated protein FliL